MYDPTDSGLDASDNPLDPLEHFAGFYGSSADPETQFSVHYNLFNFSPGPESRSRRDTRGVQITEGRPKGAAGTTIDITRGTKEFSVPSRHSWSSYDEISGYAFRGILAYSQFLVQGLSAWEDTGSGQRNAGLGNAVSMGAPTSASTWDETLTGRWSGVAIGTKHISKHPTGWTRDTPFKYAHNRGARADVDITLRFATGNQKVDMRFHNWRATAVGFLPRIESTEYLFLGAESWAVAGFGTPSDINVRNLRVRPKAERFQIGHINRVEISKDSASSATTSHSLAAISRLSQWDVNGVFYGPEAQEIGGTFEFSVPALVSVGASETIVHTIRGAFGAKKQ